MNVVRYLEEDVAVFVLSNNGRAAHAVTAAVEGLLFEPVRLKAAIDVRPYQLGTPRVLSLAGPVGWRPAWSGNRLVRRTW